MSLTPAGQLAHSQLPALKFLSSLIVKVILAICMWASAQSSRSSAVVFLWGDVAPMIYLQEGLCYVKESHSTFVCCCLYLVLFLTVATMIH
jgi:hypothetical protein